MAQLKRFGFGLQALIAMASRPDQWSSAELADQIRCEPTALRKILSQMTEAGLVEAKQGRSGGYKLVKRPEEITLVEVYRSVHEADPGWDGIADTAGDGWLGETVRESFGRIMADINVQVVRVLGTYTIADLLK